MIKPLKTQVNKSVNLLIENQLATPVSATSQPHSRARQTPRGATPAPGARGITQAIFPILANPRFKK